MSIYPKKLKHGDTIGIVCLSYSAELTPKDVIDLAIQRLQSLGLQVKISPTCFFNENDSVDDIITKKVDGFQDMVQDKNVHGILAMLGGEGCRDILSYIDYSKVKENPKIICGYSDTNYLLSAITKKTGIVTYYGPTYSLFGMKYGHEYSVEYFKKCVMGNDIITLEPSKVFSEDKWYKNQEDRVFTGNNGYIEVIPGVGEGKFTGGNISIISDLIINDSFPVYEESILFLEDDKDLTVDILQNTINLLAGKFRENITGIVLGRLPQKLDTQYKDIFKIIEHGFPKVPFIYGVDIGHTYPMNTFPIGGEGSIKSGKACEIVITHH